MNILLNTPCDALRSSLDSSLILQARGFIFFDDREDAAMEKKQLFVVHWYSKISRGITLHRSVGMCL